jgi:hypothetical protein
MSSLITVKAEALVLVLPALLVADSDCAPGDGLAPLPVHE